MLYKYYINIYERGEFNADVRAEDGTTVFEICSMYHLWDLLDAGFMYDHKDITGLWDYLCGIGVLGNDNNDRLVSGN